MHDLAEDTELKIIHTVPSHNVMSQLKTNKMELKFEKAFKIENKKISHQEKEN